MKRLTLILWLLPVLAGADLVPSTNRIDWSIYSGVEGGIPHRTTIWTNLPAGASRATIQAALNNADSNSVVQLTNGTYDLAGGDLYIPSGKTLRGVGSNTLIRGTAGFRTSVIMFSVNPFSLCTLLTNCPLLSGYTKGSSNLVLASPTSGLLVGTIINVNERTDHTWVSDVGYEASSPLNECGECTNEVYGWGVPCTNSMGDCTNWCDRWWHELDGDNGRRLRGQFVQVKSISQTTNLTVWPPLFSSYKSELYPYVQIWLDQVNFAGVEDLTVTNTDPSGGCVMHQFAANCWSSNVWMHYRSYPAGGVQSMHCFRPTVEHCWFQRHGGVIDEDLDSAAIYWIGPSGGTRTVNNIFVRPVHALCFKGRGGAHVFAYNYTVMVTNYSTMGICDVIPHGGQSEFSLVEGNDVSRIQFDSIHAGSSHQPHFLRNRVRGPNNQMVTYGHGYIWIDCSNWWGSVVGNVCGTTGDRTFTNAKPWTWLFESQGGDASADNFYGLRFACSGYNQHTTESNATSQGHSLTRWTTTVAHNYEYLTETLHADDGTGDTNIANSYLYASKPTWFGFLKWPPVSPWDLDYSTSITNIPAGYRYTFGTNPPAAAGGGETPTAPVNLRVIGRTRVGTMRGQ